MQQCDAKTFPFPAIALSGSGVMRCKDGCSLRSISGLMLKHSCCSLASNGNQAPIKETGEVHRPMLVEMLLCSGEQFFKPFKKTKHTKTTAHE
ncbi:hypothetical protein HN011_005746 [Eciton burchellii]|nr:hypothetical protein HN011_005746 [Eciton burchellii]